MAATVVLDVRTLEHPQPFEKAVAAFHALASDELLHMIHRKNPLPLLELLDKQPHASYKSIQDKEGIWHIYIAKRATLDLEDFDVC